MIIDLDVARRYDNRQKTARNYYKQRRHAASSSNSSSGGVHGCEQTYKPDAADGSL